MARFMLVAMVALVGCSEQDLRERRERQRTDAEAEAIRAKTWPCIPSYKMREWVQNSAALPTGLPKACAHGLFSVNDLQPITEK